jgi:uncharacterized membrane protein (DUF485 family)
MMTDGGLPDEEARSRFALWRRLTAWLFPFLTVSSSVAFFILLAAGSRWITVPFEGGSLSFATVVAMFVLLTNLMTIFVYAWLAERAERDAEQRRRS